VVNTWEKDFNYLNESIVSQEFTQFIDGSDIKKVYEDKLASRYKGWSDKRILFEVYRQYIAAKITDDFMAFAYWVSDPKCIFDIHWEVWEFLQTGHLAPKYKKSIGQNGFFVYNEKSNTDLVMIPRSLGKTYMFHCIRAMWEVVRQPHKKWLMLHGDGRKVKENLKVVQSITLHPRLSLIMPELFTDNKKELIDRGGRITQERVNITFDARLGKEWETYETDASLRRESTFTIGAPKIDNTGLHFDGVFADDLVVSGTSKTKVASDTLKSYFRNLGGLAEDFKDYPKHLTGTEWYENSLYHEVRKHATTFICPATWEEGKTKYFICKEKIDDAVVVEQKIEMGVEFEPQFMMNPLPLEANVQLVTDENFIFAFSDEVTPYPTIPSTVRDLRNQSGVVTSKDPSYSVINKTWESDCSKDTTITCYVNNGTIYVVDSKQLLGGDNQLLFSTLKSQVEKHGSDVFVQDSQGTQGNLALDFHRQLRALGHKHIQLVQHKGGKNKNLKSKAERAMFFLAELFGSGKIKIHHSCSTLIDEIMRRSQGYDFLDTLIQVACLNLDAISELYTRRITFRKPIRKKIKRKQKFKIAGY